MTFFLKKHTRWPIIFSILLLSSCATTPPPEPQISAPEPAVESVIPVNHQTFSHYIIEYPGPALVVFYNTQYWQSVDMLRRIEWLAANYPGKARFAKFHWQVNDDASSFGLEMLPTVLLYQNGLEIDRIKGIPPEERERAKWNDDIELWFLKTALRMKGSEYSGDYTYKFNNDFNLIIGNY
jgi:hypothetical protein